MMSFHPCELNLQRVLVDILFEAEYTVCLSLIFGEIGPRFIAMENNTFVVTENSGLFVWNICCSMRILRISPQ